jgi:hypothetical protein
MANEITYEWKLTGIVKSTAPSLSVDNVVVGTRWVVTGTDENGNSGTFNGATPFELSTVDVDNFTPYAELTEEQVLDWVKNYVNVSNPYWTHIAEQIQKQIEKSQQIIEEISADDLPWAPPREVNDINESANEESEVSESEEPEVYEGGQ